MPIWKIDGIDKDHRGRKDEEDFKIYLNIDSRRKGILINVEITPLYCTNCKNQLDGFFAIDGSRYGQVGCVICDHCEAEIHCFDNGSYVDQLETYNRGEAIPLDSDQDKFVIDYISLYRLDNQIWTEIKEKTGYDIIEKHKNSAKPFSFTLEDVINEICSENNIELCEQRTVTTKPSEPIKHYPKIISKWFCLLDSLNI